MCIKIFLFSSLPLSPILYHTGAIDMDQFRKDILKEDEDHHKKKVADTNQATGYRPDKDTKK